MSASTRKTGRGQSGSRRAPGAHGAEHVAHDEGGATPMRPPTLPEILERLAWQEETPEGVTRQACPPAMARLIATEVAASCDPRRFLDHLAEAAQELRPRFGVSWSELLILVRNTLDATDIAMARSHIILHGRIRARADAIRAEAEAGTRAMPDSEARDIARLSLQGDRNALDRVARAAARQGRTLADLDALALQTQLDRIQILAALAHGANQRMAGLLERLGKQKLAEMKEAQALLALAREAARGRREASREAGTAVAAPADVTDSRRAAGTPDVEIYRGHAAPGGLRAAPTLAGTTAGLEEAPDGGDPLQAPSGPGCGAEDDHHGG